MTRASRIIALVLIAGSIVAALWLEGREARTKTEQAAPPHSATGPLSPSAVLAIDVAHASPVPGRQAQPASPSVARAFDTARNLKPLYDSLMGPNAPDTAAAKFVRYEILRLCGTIDMDKPAPAKWSPERRKALADSMADSLGEKKQRRLAAFDRLAARCEGLEGITATRKEMIALLDDAAQGGDPTARAVRIEREIKAAGTGQIEEAQLRELRDILESRDPAAIYAVGTVMSNTYMNAVVEVNGHELDGPAAARAWRLIACDYGMECGPDSRYLDAACVTSGWCRAGNVADFTYFYGTSPSGAQTIDQYRRIFRQAVESGDWTQVQAVWRSNNPANSLFIAPWSPP